MGNGDDDADERVQEISSTVRVGISTLLDGSSRIRTLAPLTRTDKRYSLRFSPPESLEIGVYCISGVNRKRSRHLRCADAAVTGLDILSDIFHVVAHALIRIHVRLFLCQIAERIVSPISMVPASGRTSPVIIRSIVDFPQPFGPMMPHSGSAGRCIRNLSSAFYRRRLC